MLRRSLRTLSQLLRAALACVLLITLASLVCAAEPPPVTPELAKIFASDKPQSVADLAAMEQHVQKLVDYVTPFTVGVSIGRAQGSGVIISKDGYVLTAGHVVGRPDRKVSIILPDGKTVNGITKGMNNGIDSGLIKITDPGEWPHAEMGDSTVKQGTWVLGLGHPGGYQSDRSPPVRLGRVLNARKQVLVTDSALVGGDSGGPLFDMSGKVIGIHSRISGPLTSNMHVPVNTYRESWDRLVKGEAWGFVAGTGPYLGVAGDPNSDAPKIAEVFPGSPAEKAGLKADDVVTKFGTREIKDFGTLVRLVGEGKPGDKITLEVRRGDKTQSIEATLGRKE